MFKIGDKVRITSVKPTDYSERAVRKVTRRQWNED